MIHGFLFLFLSVSAQAANVPYYPRDTKSNQDMGGINQNFADISSCFQNSLAPNTTPSFCPSGSVLSGAYYNPCGTTFGGTCIPVGVAGSTSSFWSASGSDIKNTNAGAVNMIGGGGIDSNIASMKTTSTTWTWSFANPTTYQSNPTLRLTDGNNGGLTLDLIDVPGGQRLFLWPNNVNVSTLSTTGIYPTMGIFGDIAIGDIASLANNPMSLFYRVNRNIPYTSCTNFFSSYNTNNIASDVDGGTTVSICPTDNTGPNGNNDGIFSVDLWGQDTGSLANTFRITNRKSAGVRQTLFLDNSNGLQQDVGGISSIGTQASQIANSIFIDESGGAGRLAAVGNAGTYAVMQLLSTNGSGGNRVLGTFDGTNQRFGFLKGAPQSTYDIQGTASFGSTTQSTFTANGSLNMPSAATITDLGNSGNTLLVTNSGSQYTSLPLLGNGGLPIGNGVYPSTGTLTAGTGIVITNAPGSITIAASTSTVSTTTYTSGSGTYSVPANTSYLVVDMVGGGGGGGGDGTGPGVGGNGGNTTFGTSLLTANGGTGGGTNGVGGAGGSTTGCDIGITGAIGGYGFSIASIGGGGGGGVSYFGGAGPGPTTITHIAGIGAQANSGSGGSAGVSVTAGASGGGGAGGYCRTTLLNPAATYSYAVGGAGAAGSAGVGGDAGGAGAAGIIYITAVPLAGGVNANPLLYSIVTKTTNYNITLADGVILGNGTLTLTLPDSTITGTAGRAFLIKNIGTGIVTLATTSSQTIDGVTTYVIRTTGSGVTVVSDGANWRIIGVE